MNLDWNSFTPESTLAGGIIFGLAAALFILVTGRTPGISGIIGDLFRPSPSDISWRVAFLLWLSAALLIFGLSKTLPNSQVDAEWTAFGIVGLLVGIGTRCGTACTSGHGFCGLSRLSLRSLIATLRFMATGLLTVYILRDLAGGV